MCFIRKTNSRLYITFKYINIFFILLHLVVIRVHDLYGVTVNIVACSNNASLGTNLIEGKKLNIYIFIIFFFLIIMMYDVFQDAFCY